MLIPLDKKKQAYQEAIQDAEKFVIKFSATYNPNEIAAKMTNAVLLSGRSTEEILSFAAKIYNIFFYTLNV